MTHFQNYADLQAALDLPAAMPGAFRFCKPYGPATFKCSDCGHAKPLATEGAAGTGYARVGKDDADMICYECAGVREERDLLAKGKGYLYLTSEGNAHKLTNWPGTISIRIGYVRTGRHNMAGRRYDLWFNWKGRDWHGVQYGDNTQICHVRALKRASA